MKNCQAIQFEQFGEPDVLQWKSIAMPRHNEQQLLLKVAAAGVNPIDAKIREGSSFVAQNLSLPSGLGFDVCGEVIAVGKHTEGFSNGDLVLGCAALEHPSTYAQYCAIDATRLTHKPSTLDITTAGALSLAGLTAWQAVHQYGKISPGERVLIHAAAGGVGHLAVQFAHLAGAYVIGTASNDQHRWLKDHGADEVIDYKKTNFVEVLDNIDLVIDLVGGDTGTRSLKVLKKTGRLLTVPTITRDAILNEAQQLGIAASGMVMTTQARDLKQIADLVASLQVTCRIEKSFALKDAALAHSLLRQPKRSGKIVLLA